MKNTFLNGDLKEEVFMNLPSGFEKKLGKEKVCRLKKSLYCFKLFPGACFERFGKVIKLQEYIYIYIFFFFFFSFFFFEERGGGMMKCKVEKFEVEKKSFQVKFEGSNGGTWVSVT